MDGKSLVPLYGDPGCLRKIFQNLVGNAIKYVPPGTRPSITITANRIDAGRVAIDVTDNGIGIDTDYHERIFTPFKRVHEGDYEGTGIGLALVRKLARKNGGDVAVLTSTPGEGTTFRVVLLTAKPSDVLAEPTPSPTSETTTS